MRLLVLSFYFTPDLSAGSFRTAALVKALRERAPAGLALEVVTTLPNRYGSYALAAAREEVSDGVAIRRIPLPPHQSDILGQSRAFLSFARGALTHVAGRRYDLVYATSSRLMTAALGAWIARRQHARLYLDIRDIFADTIGDVLPSSVAPLARRVFAHIESWTVRRADRVNLVSPGFAAYFRGRYGARPFAEFTNGIDEEFVAVPAPASRAPRSGPPTVLYAGNIGDGQGLHELLPGLAGALRGRCRFVVIGDGGRRLALEQALARSGADNVELRDPVPRAELIRSYQEADVLLLHLGRYPALEKVLPSKLFEYGALGKPILAGVSGCAATFINAELDNAAVFAPCDVSGAVAAFESLQLSDRPRAAFVARYARSRIAAAMADDVLALAAAGARGMT